jgi:hypothetical protein
MEDSTMVGHRFAVTAFTFLALAIFGGRATAQEEANKAEGTRLDRLEGLATKLGLNDQQKQEVNRIQADFDKKVEPVEQQLWNLHQQEHAAMCKVLTEDQRTKIQDIMKTAWQTEAPKLAAQLNLNDDQKQRLQKIGAEYGPQFCALMEKQGADSFKEYRDLRSKVHKELRQVLTEEQRTRLPGIMREEFHKWHDPAARKEKLTAVADKLGLNNEQREQFQKIAADFNRQMEQPTTQFKQLHRDEHAAIEKMLTPEQREKFQTLSKSKIDEK